MNINSIVIIETLIYITLAIALGKYIYQTTKNNVYTIFNYIIWAFISILSISINLNKMVYFISSIIVGSLVIVGYILLKFKFNVETSENKDNLMLFFYILLATSIISIIGFVLSKKYMISMANSQAPAGPPGEMGAIGKQGKSYFVETIPEKCYNEAINAAEKLLVSIKKANKIPFKSKEYQLNNQYFKNNIKRICYSKQFLNPFYGLSSISNINQDANKKPECVNHPYPSRRICNNKDDFGNTINCEQNIDCYRTGEYNYDTIYRKRITLIKRKVSEWIKEILKNNCDEDIKLKESLGGKPYEDLSDLNISDNDLRRFNNKTGHKFLEDYFLNNVYWDEHLVKRINNNPFDIIKNDNVWKWGIPIKNDLQNCSVPTTSSI